MYKLKENDQLVVYLDRPLSTFNQNFFTKCFSPILSPLANNLYTCLNSFVKPALLESDKMTFKKLMQRLNTKKCDDILNARLELEALGLIKTYFKSSEIDNFYIIVINDLLTPYAFFKNSFYREALISQIGEESYNDLIKEYLIHLYDLKQMEDVTSKVDEVFSLSNDASYWQDNMVDINLKNNHFNYDYVKLLLASLILDEELNSVTFYNQLNRLAWMFNLNDDQLIKACKASIVEQKLDYEALRTNCKKAVQKEFKLVKLNIEQQSSSKLINTLNQLSPSALVKNTYHTDLTPSEMEMFDRLMVETNISTGVLNSLIIYVMNMKNGEIPSYNYFLKIANTWIRKGVKTTEDALNEMNGEKPKNKKERQKPEWFKEYQDELKKKEQEEKAQEDTESVSLDELREFFNK